MTKARSSIQRSKDEARRKRDAKLVRNMIKLSENGKRPTRTQASRHDFNDLDKKIDRAS